MTNNPPYPKQKDRYDYFKHFIGDPPILYTQEMQTRGVETYGLNGDYTSMGRFSRLTYLKEKVESNENGEFININQAFHLLSSVEQLYGVAPVKDNYEYTIYSIVYDMNNKKIYLRFYNDLEIQVVGMI